MSNLIALKCLRCQRRYPPGRMFFGCPHCQGRKSSNLQGVYDYEAIGQTFDREQLCERELTLWRYREFLPVSGAYEVSVAEGMTPLIHCQRLGQLIDVPNLFVKDESRNATWSFKDRLASVAVSKALEFGAPAITTSSSGNGGAATAAYAAKAGLPCVVFTTTQFPQTMRTLMQVYGAMLVTVPTVEDRWRMVEQCVRKLDWYPVQGFLNPPIGSNPYGIDGLKTIAYEVCEQLRWRAPDVFVVPVTVGDALVGPWKGFNEFRELGYVDSVPRMVAAEVFGPLKNALEKGLDYVEKVPSGPTVAVSAGSSNSTYQSLKTVRDSGGMALTVNDEETLRMQLQLAETEGIYAEAASVLPLAAIKKMRERGAIEREEVAVALLTSSGLKDPAVSTALLPEAPTIEPALASLQQVLKQTYDFHLP